MASDHMTDHVQILHDPVLQALVIVLRFVLLGLTARATNLLLRVLGPLCGGPYLQL
jgi:hypothetical protein